MNYSDVVFLYGDPSAGKRTTIDANNRSFYDKFIEVLRAAGYTVTSRVQRSAPEVALSAAFINGIYESNLVENPTQIVARITVDKQIGRAHV